MAKGKFFIDRKIFESDIWEKPAYYLKIWIWIIGKANWKTIKKGGKIYHRGEFLTNYDEIIKANRWKIGYRYEYLTKNDISYVLGFLKKTGRIKTAKTTSGLWIKVVKYDEFQKLYETSTKLLRSKQRGKHEINSEANNEANSEAKSIQTAFKQGKRKKEKKENTHSGKPSSPVREIIFFFKSQVKEINGFDPEINWGKDGKMVKQRLNKYPPEQLKDLISWYLESGHSERLGISLATCLSAYIINLWKADTTAH